MKKSLEQLRKDINTALNAIKSRYSYYTAARANIQKSITEYFFTAANETKLLGVMSFIAGYPAGTAVEAQTLFSPFDQLPEFDQRIVNSGLGLQLDGERFQFRDTHNLEPHNVVFIKQLALALSCYRACYTIEFFYHKVLQERYVLFQGYERFLPEIKELIRNYEQIMGSTPPAFISDWLNGYYEKALALQKKLIDLYPLVRENKSSFAQLMETGTSVICPELNITGQYLVNSHKDYPDSTRLGNAPWTLFSIELINQLFASSYSYSWYIGGTVTINPGYESGLATELTSSSLVLQTDMDHLKLGLLTEASTVLHEFISRLRTDAVLNNVVLKNVEQSSHYRQPRLPLMFNQRVTSHVEYLNSTTMPLL